MVSDGIINFPDFAAHAHKTGNNLTAETANIAELFLLCQLLCVLSGKNPVI